MRSWLVFLCLLPLFAHAVVETYEFSGESERARYLDFTRELRCPKCQNQNLADSNAPIAADLRRELHRMLEAGMSDEEIVDFMVSRYGDYVLYRPAVSARTVLLWSAPLLLMVLAALLLWRVHAVGRATRGSERDPAAELSEEERDRLKRLLDDGDVR